MPGVEPVVVQGMDSDGEGIGLGREGVAVRKGEDRGGADLQGSPAWNEEKVQGEERTRGKDGVSEKGRGPTRGGARGGLGTNGWSRTGGKEASGRGRRPGTVQGCTSRWGAGGKL